MFGFDRECLSESLLGLLLYVYTLHYRVTTLKGREGGKKERNVTCVSSDFWVLSEGDGQTVERMDESVFT